MQSVSCKVFNHYSTSKWKHFCVKDFYRLPGGFWAQIRVLGLTLKPLNGLRTAS